jgi:DNA-binding NarL/FixJ family response regulator
MTTSAPPSELLGRDAEWASIDAFLVQIAGGSAAAVIEGEAGIGKTTLWQAAVAASIREPFRYRVLRARPTSADAGIAYAVLLELFDDLPEAALAELPELQRQALEVALRRRSSDAGADAGTIAVASLGVIRALAAEAPVVLAIDDLHEADPAAIRVLEFVVRRLETETVGILVARRPAGDPSLPLRFADTLPPDRLRAIRPSGISVGALNRLLTDRLGVTFARPLVVRIHGTTAGNPQYALEIGRELKAGGIETLPASAALPVPGTIQEVVDGRLARLDTVTRDAIAFAAEMERPTRAILRSVMPDSADRAVDDALAADVLVEDGGALRFTHPLVRAAAATAVAHTTRRLVHERLAELTRDPEERAQHLGRCAAAPSVEVAAALDQGAAAAAARGAPEAALRLLERALELTPPNDSTALARRRVALADAVSDSGDFGRSRALLDLVMEAGDGVEPGTRYEAAILLGTLLWYDNEGPAGRRLLLAMLDEPAADRLSRARIHSRLAWLTDDNVPQAAAHAKAALDLMSQDEDPAAYAFALLNRALNGLLAGELPDHQAVRRGGELQDRQPSAEISAVPGLWHKFADRFDDARAWLEKDLARLRGLGDEGSIGQSLGYLAEIVGWTGDFATARRHAEEGLELIRQIGQRGMLAVAVGRRVQIDAMEGRDDAAADGYAEMRRLEVELPDLWTSVMCDQVEAILGINTGNLAAVERAASHATELLDAIGLVEPVMFRYHADQIEAVIGLGHLERAEQLLERFEERGRIFPRPWISATSARGRAWLSAARGDHARAVEHLDRALAAHADLDWPVERIRTLIAGAQVLRRANRRKRAHALAIEAALLADRIGAPGWATRARSEAARLGIEHGDGEQLTPSERRIAEMAADGATNRVIADRLLVSPKTVEATLARAYAKLGIRSRAQLHARLQGDRPET